jgi:hypothetical protein
VYISLHYVILYHRGAGAGVDIGDRSIVFGVVVVGDYRDCGCGGESAEGEEWKFHYVGGIVGIAGAGCEYRV